MDRLRTIDPPSRIWVGGSAAIDLDRVVYTEWQDADNATAYPEDREHAKLQPEEDRETYWLAVFVTDVLDASDAVINLAAEEGELFLRAWTEYRRHQDGAS